MAIFNQEKDKGTKEIEDLKKVQYAVDMIRKIDMQYSDVKQNNIDAFDHYFGMNYMKDIQGRSQVYTQDLMDTVEWIMPAIVKIFAGGDDVASLTPRKKEQAKQVENHNELINYQIKVKNKWFIAINDWFKDALLLKRGAVKYQWYKEIQKETKDYEGLSEAEYQTFLNDPNVVEVVEVKENEIMPAQPMVNPFDGNIDMMPSVKTYDCTLKYEYRDEYPLIEAVPAEEFGFPIDARDIEDCTFFYHRVKYDKWNFIERYGKDKFKKVEDLKDTFLDTTDDLSVDQERFVDINGVAIKFFYDINDNKWLVYECFFRDKDDGKPMISVICGNTLLEHKENPYKKPPFRIVTPVKLSHRILGVSVYDQLKSIQKIRTSLMRQFLDNIYFNNNGRTVIDPTRISYEEFLNGNRPGGVIRTLDGNPANEQAVMPVPTPQLPPWAFNILELINTEKDYHTGVPRSYQGVNPQVLNKTMRGQNQQVQLAQQRVEMMARLFAEMGIAPLIRDVVDMNSRFLKKETAIKVVNDWITVTPEDVVAKADVIINVGLGTTSKDTLVTQNQQMIALYMQLYPIFGQALNDKMLHALKELVKAMGYRDTQNWVPGEEEMNQAVLQMQQMQLAQQGGRGTQPGQKTPLQGGQPAQPAEQNNMIPDIYGGYFG